MPWRPSARPRASWAANPEAGKAKAAEVCAACHGADGNSASPDFPRLAGQHRDYLAKALRDYKSGLRKNPIMAGFRDHALEERHREPRGVLRGAAGGALGEVLTRFDCDWKNGAEGAFFHGWFDRVPVRIRR